MAGSITRIASLLAIVSLSGCAVVAVADAAVTVGATVVKAGAEVVGTAVHVVSSGVKAVTKDKDADAAAKK